MGKIRIVYLYRIRCCDFGFFYRIIINFIMYLLYLFIYFIKGFMYMIWILRKMWESLNLKVENENGRIWLGWWIMVGNRDKFCDLRG